MTSSVVIGANELRQFVAHVFQAAGVAVDEACVVAESLVDSNLCGHESHGVIRVMEYLDGIARHELQAGQTLHVINRTSAAVICDGGYGFGQRLMRELIEQVVPMAREQGIACGTVRRCGHVGRLGEWMERLADQQLAGVMSVNDNGVLRCVAPPGGLAPCISTNPLAIGVPTRGAPIVLDISTSVVANGKVTVARLAGTSCPDGWLLDAEGHPTNDPQVRVQDPPGTLRPMGGYKGFGLGLLLDMLVGGLTGGFCPPAPTTEPECNNVWLLAIDPARFAGFEHFVAQATVLSQFVRETPLVPGAEKIRLPNERSAETRRQRLISGVPLDAGTWQALLARANEFGVPAPVAQRSHLSNP